MVRPGQSHTAYLHVLGAFIFLLQHVGWKMRIDQKKLEKEKDRTSKTP